MESSGRRVVDDRILQLAVFEISRALSSTLELTKVLNLSVDLLEGMIPFEGSCFFLYDEKKQAFHNAAMRNLSEREAHELHTRFFPHILKKLEDTHQPVIIHFAKQPQLRFREESHSALVLPIFFEQRMTGIFILEGSTPGLFTAMDVRMLMLLANQLSISIENAKLYRSMMQRVSELSGLHEASTTLSMTLSLDEILDHILNFTTQHLEAPHILILLAERETLSVKRISGFPALAAETKIQFGKELSGLCAKEQQVIVMNHISAKKKASFSETRHEDIESILSFPLLSHGHVLGVLTIGKTLKDGFSEETVRMFTILSSLFAAFMQNSLLFEQTKTLSITDGLTNTYNHRYFQEYLTREVQRSERYKNPVSMAMIDIDNFKAVNDAYGHRQGDIILRNVADLLKRNYRDVDFIARYGGEEFAVVLPETDVLGAYVATERCRALIQKHKFRIMKKNAGLKITISCGVASCPKHASTKENFINVADAALYKAKEEGRNKVCLPDGP